MKKACPTGRPLPTICQLCSSGIFDFEGSAMSNSLWPNFSVTTPTRGLRDMLYEAAGDIDAQTNGAIRFYVDTLGVSGAVKQVRHNCYLRVPKTDYSHLL